MEQEIHNFKIDADSVFYSAIMYSHAHYQIEFISGSGAVPVNWNVIVFSPRFAIFKGILCVVKLKV